jgi:MOSC domain-containing protein YiiM
MARVLHLFRAHRKHLPMEALAEVTVVANFGFQGCVHGRPGSKRQALLVDSETLDAMNLEPGIIRENITTEGLNVNGLKIGEQLQIDDVLLEVAAVCTPCDQLEKVRSGLCKELWGRRGMLCRVIAGGTIRRGDPIERLSSLTAR